MDDRERLYARAIRYAHRKGMPRQAEPEDVALLALLIAERWPYDASKAARDVWERALVKVAWLRVWSKASAAKRRVTISERDVEEIAASPPKDLPKSSVRPTLRRTNALTRGILTPKQREVLTAMLSHDTYREAAKDLGISYNTICYHLEAARSRLGVATLHRAIVHALVIGEIRLDALLHKEVSPAKGMEDQ